MLYNPVGHKRSLAFGVVGLVITNLFALTQFRRGVERLGHPPSIALDYLVGRFEDRLSRAIILFELYDLRPDEVVLKPKDDVEVGPSERIDALIDIAHHAQASSLPEVHGCALHLRRTNRNQPRQLILNSIGVLKLVDHQVTEAIVIILPDIGHTAKQLNSRISKSSKSSAFDFLSRSS